MSEQEPEKINKLINDYKLIKFLGKGKFSTVWQAECQKTGRLVAMKIIKIFDMMDKKQREKCLQEVKLLQTVDHPNIVKYLDSFIHDNELHIAIEWAEKGDLKRYIRKLIQEKDYLDELKVYDFTRQLACALQHMHDKRIIHRDLKPANILVFSDGKLKLGDLGLGRFLSVETIKAFSKVGTPLYMSPELIRNTGYDFKTDVWSLGCVCYELILLKSPFVAENKLSLFDLFSKIENGDYPKITDPRLSNDIKDLVEKMLTVNPEDRISLLDAIKQIEVIMNSIEDKPKVDPFIVMEDILEKLRLINYENNYCRRYKKELMTRYTFSCNVYGKPNTPGVLSYEGSSVMNNISQFRAFYDLSSWLIYIIKAEVSINKLSSIDLPGKMFDKKRNIDEMLPELLVSLKSIGVKILENSKIVNGFGEGVCLIVTQLLDRYLISQNYIFKKPVCEGKESKDSKDNKDNRSKTINNDNKSKSRPGTKGSTTTSNNNTINTNNNSNNPLIKPQTPNPKNLPEIDIAVEVIDEYIQITSIEESKNAKEQRVSLNSRTTVNNTRNLLQSRQSNKNKLTETNTAKEGKEGIDQPIDEEVRCYREKILSESQERNKINSAASNYTKETSYTDREIRHLGRCNPVYLGILRTECSKVAWSKEVSEIEPMLVKYEEELFYRKGKSNNSNSNSSYSKYANDSNIGNLSEYFDKFNSLFKSKPVKYNTTNNADITTNLLEMNSFISIQNTKLQRMEQSLNTTLTNNNTLLSHSQTNQLSQISQIKSNTSSSKIEEISISKAIKQKESKLQQHKDKLFQINNKINTVENHDPVKEKNKIKDKIDELIKEVKQYNLSCGIISEKMLTMQCVEMHEIRRKSEGNRYGNSNSNGNGIGNNIGTRYVSSEVDDLFDVIN